MKESEPEDNCQLHNKDDDKSHVHIYIYITYVLPRALFTFFKKSISCPLLWEEHCGLSGMKRLENEHTLEPAFQTHSHHLCRGGNACLLLPLFSQHSSTPSPPPPTHPPTLPPPPPTHSQAYHHCPAKQKPESTIYTNTEWP